MINNCEDLDKAIEELERKKVIREAMLSAQLDHTKEHFKPGNLAKSALSNLIHSDGVKGLLFKAVGGLGAGLLAKQALIGHPATFAGKMVNNLLGKAIKVGIPAAVIKNNDKISAWTSAIYKNLFSGSSNKKKITY